MPNAAVLLQGLLAAVAIGGVHFLSHSWFGKDWAFEKAGVRRSGLVLMLVTFVATVFALSTPL